MIESTNAKSVVSFLAESLELPDSSYEAATKRYRDLGDWLHDKSKSQCAQFAPDVFPQGSFRLGTAIKPWKQEDYDLDLVCTLKSDITTANYTQYRLKSLLGEDLNNYRKERSIAEALEEKHRCWRLNYQDTLKFHMDTSPSIPHEASTFKILKERMVKTGSTEAFAQNVAQMALAITDNRHLHYRELCTDWKISNPEGYAIWFESRMHQARELLESRAIMEKVASVDNLPVYRWKTPLQYAIQILKRHRDITFEKDPDCKPISIIITTLAARAYSGESDIQLALNNILYKMDSLVSELKPRIPNPVNPIEHFAEKWYTTEGLKLQLEKNFHLWLIRVKTDLEIVMSARDGNLLKEQAMLKFGVSIDERTIASVKLTLL